MIFNTIYPPVCGICGKLDNDFLCKKCKIVLNRQSNLLIEKNQNINNNFEELIYFFNYNGIIRDTILNYKFKDKSYIYKTISNFLLKDEKIFEILKTYDTIIPVPISKKRQKERGYNQSYLIAKEIAKRTELKLNNQCLFKVKNVVEQSKLNRKERIKNIQNVYCLKNENKIKNKSILLIDDIYTTGSTVNECCKIINKAKPNKIGVLVVAKD